MLHGHDDLANHVTCMRGHDGGTENLVGAFLAIHPNKAIRFTVEYGSVDAREWLSEGV
jgi:hypothetical protein